MPDLLWQHIAKQTRHRVWMTAPNSDPGDTQIHITYPCTPINLASCLTELSEQEGVAALPASISETSHLNILAVDDNDTNLRLLNVLLMDLGLSVDTCRSGAEAIEYCQKKNYDHILLDLQMPGMDGLETASVLRQRGYCKQSQITLLSAHQAAMDQSELAQFGADAYLSKPLSVDALCRLFDVKRTFAESVQATEAEDVPRPIDLQNCLARARGKRALAQEMLTLFLSSLPETRNQLMGARTDNDAQGMASLCHQLKGASSYTGVPKLREAVITLEMQLKSGNDPQACADAIEDLILRIDELLSWEQDYDVALLFED